jgi:hypothetical protein
MSIQNNRKRMKFFAELALILEGWAKNVRVTLDQTGRIGNIESGVEPNPERTKFT